MARCILSPPPSPSLSPSIPPSLPPSHALSQFIEQFWVKHLGGTVAASFPCLIHAWSPDTKRPAVHHFPRPEESMYTIFYLQEVRKTPCCSQTPCCSLSLRSQKGARSTMPSARLAGDGAVSVGVPAWRSSCEYFAPRRRAFLFRRTHSWGRAAPRCSPQPPPRGHFSQRRSSPLLRRRGAPNHRDCPCPRPGSRAGPRKV